MSPIGDIADRFFFSFTYIFRNKFRTHLIVTVLFFTQKVTTSGGAVKEQKVAVASSK